jgi:glutamate/tyrosine decarboxylase-like PLP-dependent enzyme
MLYIKKDAAGNIISLHNEPESGASEKKSLTDAEVLEFLSKHTDKDPTVQLLSHSDTSIIRILEDLIDLLIRKNVILFTELPEEAQVKIMERKQLRQKIGPDHLIADDIL